MISRPDEWPPWPEPEEGNHHNFELQYGDSNRCSHLHTRGSACEDRTRSNGAKWVYSTLFGPLRDSSRDQDHDLAAIANSLIGAISNSVLDVGGNLLPTWSYRVY